MRETIYHRYGIFINVDFLKKLKTKWDQGKFVCVGLDKGDFEFNKTIVDQTADLVCCYKPNAAFYNEADLQKTVSYIKKTHSDIPVILDAKRGDIDNTNEAYAKDIFDNLGVDAITVHPYLGEQSLKPFLERKEKTIFVLVKTSNPGASEFQDLQVDGKPFYQVVAAHVKDWNKNNNLGVVVGATYPEELKEVREIIGDMPILVPGIGAQGGDLTAVLENGLDSNKQGLIINSSRGIIFADNPKEATLRLHQEIVDSLR